MNNSTTSPFPEGTPEKPDMIEQDTITDEEWNRICAILAARRGLSPAWGGMIIVAADAFSEFVNRSAVIETHGRTEEWAALVVDTLEQYLSACRELRVDPNLLAQVRLIT